MAKSPESLEWDMQKGRWVVFHMVDGAELAGQLLWVDRYSVCLETKAPQVWRVPSNPPTPPQEGRKVRQTIHKHAIARHYLDPDRNDPL